MPTPPSQHRLSLLRTCSLIASTLIALSAGTNYVYSAYAPQLGERLSLSAKQINLIGTAGNLGMYVTGIPAGLMVDRRGPRLPILLGALGMFVGYYPVWAAMRAAGEGEVEAGHVHSEGGDPGVVVWLSFCMAVSGAGSSFAFSGALKTAAMNFPRHRGSATAVVLAAFGLSAFFFSSLSAWLFPGNTDGFLLLLAVATSGITALGFLFCRIVPVGAGGGGYRAIAPGDGARLHRTRSAEEREQKTKKWEQEDPGTSCSESPTASSSTTMPRPNDAEDVDESSSLFSASSAEEEVERGSAHGVDEKPALIADIRGWQLMRNTDFWYLFGIMGCLAGCGLMTINNVGHDAQALWNFYDPHTPPHFIQTQQGIHVSLLSLTSFLGRLLSGITSDLLHRRSYQRANLLIISSFIFVLAQFAGILISNPHFLFFVSALNGLGYGMLFGVSPTIVSEYFSVHHMSTNWGALTLAAVVGGNVGNMAYGGVYDARSRRMGSGRVECTVGLQCYRDAYLVTLGMAVAGGLTAAGLVRRNRHLVEKA